MSYYLLCAIGLLQKFEFSGSEQDEIFSSQNTLYQADIDTRNHLRNRTIETMKHQS